MNPLVASVEELQNLLSFLCLTFIVLGVGGGILMWKVAWREEEKRRKAANLLAANDDKRRADLDNPNLMSCPDCNTRISRKAASCPQCGCPLK